MTYDRHLQNQMELWAQIDKEGAVPCEELPDVFFPEDFPERTMRTKAIKVAKSLCEECPVRVQCLATAMLNREGYGIWGGLTPAERGYVGR